MDAIEELPLGKSLLSRLVGIEIGWRALDAALPTDRARKLFVAFALALLAFLA